MLSLLLFLLYILFSIGDCIWAEKRSHLRAGRLQPEDLTSLKRRIYTRRFRLLKFFLMPLLLGFYLSSSLLGWPLTVAFLPRSPLVSVIFALIFGWGGDTLLELSPALFPFGLFSFLLGHIFYVTAFLTPRAGAASVLSFPTFSRAVFPLILLLILVVYGVLMVRRLLFLPETKKLRVPLMLYLVMLIVLLLSAGLYLNAGRNLGGLLCFLGAALFVTSDSILAFHLFTDRPDSGVMETYTSAQLLLVLGLLLP